MPTITPCLWFDNQAEEAAEFYTSIFPNSRINAVTRYGPAAPQPEGTVMTVSFELDGQDYLGLNGGPQFPFTEAVSLIVNCETQEEIDHYWKHLTTGGQEVQCGWLKDKFGLSWQIVPRQLSDWLKTADQEAMNRVTAAVSSMVKLDLAALRQAYEQAS